MFLRRWGLEHRVERIPRLPLHVVDNGRPIETDMNTRADEPWHSLCLLFRKFPQRLHDLRGLAIVNLECVDQGEYVCLIVDCCLHYGSFSGVPAPGEFARIGAVAAQRCTTAPR